MRPLILRASRAYVSGYRSSLGAAGRSRQLHGSRGGFHSMLLGWPRRQSRVDHRPLSEHLEALGRAGSSTAYISVKAPALEYSRTHFGEVLDAARRQKVRMHFDSLAPETVAPTFSLIRDLGPRDGDVGCTLPGRWRRSIADVDRAVELDLTVRVVKGQWVDTEAPRARSPGGLSRGH